MRTQLSSAPTKFPRCSLPVERIPLSTRFRCGCREVIWLRSNSNQNGIGSANKRRNQSTKKISTEIDKCHQPKPSYCVIGFPHGFGQKVPQNMAAVEGRYWYEIENAQHDIDDHQLVSEEADWHEH